MGKNNVLFCVVILAVSVMTDAIGQSDSGTPGFSDPLKSGGRGPAMLLIRGGNWVPGHQFVTRRSSNAAAFLMGCDLNECSAHEQPVHRVSIPYKFAVSIYEVTIEDYDRFVNPNGTAQRIRNRDRLQHPVTNVSWSEAMAYVAWLSGQTGQDYRLLSEAEWEYVAQGHSTRSVTYRGEYVHTVVTTPEHYGWGHSIGINQANCVPEDSLPSTLGGTCGDAWETTAPVGSFAKNAFGVHDMNGNVWEWVGDCWNENYQGAPSDGSAWLSGECSRRVLRGGGWNSVPWSLRASNRHSNTIDFRDNSIGFRVARTVTETELSRLRRQQGTGSGFAGKSPGGRF